MIFLWWAIHSLGKEVEGPLLGSKNIWIGRCVLIIGNLTIIIWSSLTSLLGPLIIILFIWYFVNFFSIINTSGFVLKMHGLRSQTLELWLNRHGQNQRTNKFFVDFSNGQIVLLNEEEPYQGNSRKRDWTVTIFFKLCVALEM